MTEAELIRGLKEGQSESFRFVFIRFYPKFLSFTMAMLKDKSASEDIMQDVFLKLWLKRECLDENKSLNNFLFVLTKRAAINYISRQMKLHESIDAAREISQPEETEENNNTEETSSKLMKIIESMPEKRRKAFLLSRFAGLSNGEIAQEMGLSINTVNRHLSMALSDLKDGLIKK